MDLFFELFGQKKTTKEKRKSNFEAVQGLLRAKRRRLTKSDDTGSKRVVPPPGGRFADLPQTPPGGLSLSGDSGSAGLTETPPRRAKNMGKRPKTTDDRPPFIKSSAQADKDAMRSPTARRKTGTLNANIDNFAQENQSLGLTNEAHKTIFDQAKDRGKLSVDIASRERNLTNTQDLTVKKLAAINNENTICAVFPDRFVPELPSFFSNNDFSLMETAAAAEKEAAAAPAAAAAAVAAALEVSFAGYSKETQSIKPTKVCSVPVEKSEDTRLALFCYFDTRSELLSELQSPAQPFVEAFFEHLDKLCCSEKGDGINVLVRFLYACASNDAVAEPTNRVSVLVAASKMLLAYFKYRTQIDGVETCYAFMFHPGSSANKFRLQKSVTCPGQPNQLYYCDVDCTTQTSTNWEELKPLQKLSGYFYKECVLPPLAKIIASCLVVGGTTKRYIYKRDGITKEMLTGKKVLNEEDVKEWTLMFEFVSPKPSGGAAAPALSNMMTRKP
jgi:hypothetical protein